MNLKPIGVIHSPFKQSKGTPIQAALAEGAEGKAVLERECLEGLKDLEGFVRVWLLYWFDRVAAGRKLVVTGVVTATGLYPDRDYFHSQSVECVLPSASTSNSKTAAPPLSRASFFEAVL